jgi:Polyprenyl synthetase
MAVREVTPMFGSLPALREPVIEAARSAVRQTCANQPPLRNAVLRLLDGDDSGNTVFRLLPAAVASAVTGDVSAALPVCVLSRLWWIGAETLDDLADGSFDAEAVGLSPKAATMAGLACFTLLPQAVIHQHGFDEPVERDLGWELVATSLHAVGGRIDDLTTGSNDYSMTRAMRGYRGRTGAAYARDLAMTGRLAGLGIAELAALRSFGRLYGVLRQLVDDRVAARAEDEEDLTNGTRTLLIVHAVNAVPEADRDELVMLHRDARDDMAARRVLVDRLCEPDIAVGYDDRIDEIHRQLSTLLEQLAQPSDRRDLVQRLITVSAASAKLSTVDGPT